MATRRREANEVSNVRYTPEKCKALNRDTKYEKKLNSKAWIKFAQWLRHKKESTAKDFKVKCECKWQHDEENKVMCKKIDDEWNEVRAKSDNNAMLNEYEHRSRAKKVQTIQG